MRFSLGRGLVIALLALAASSAAECFQAGGSAVPAEADPETLLEEKLLNEAGIASDGPGLLAYLRSRALSAADQQRLLLAVQQLGDDSFPVREEASRLLVAAGRFSLPLLQPVLSDTDPERVRRAERCVEDIEHAPHATLLIAAAHLAAVRKPKGATEALLACLPWVDDDAVEDALFRALTLTSLKAEGVEPALESAATDKEALRRAAAAHVLGRAGPEQRKQAIRLLGDSDIRVRFHAASALLRAGEKLAVPSLLAQLTDAPLSLAWQAEDLLCRVAGDQVPVATPGTWEEASRRQCRLTWEAWWKEHEPQIKLTGLNLDDIYLNLNVIAELDGVARAVGGGRIWECGPDGKPRWQIQNANRPIDARVLIGGRVLVAEHGQMRVTERDHDGKILWEHKCDSQPVSCQRLRNGNTFITTYNELLEVSPANKVVFSSKRMGMIYHGQKLRNGNMVFVQSNNQVLEVDSSGKLLKTISVGNTGGWASVEKQSTGTYLVALYSARKVVEVNESGKVIWECTVDSPGHATRLRNGNVLVASIEGRKVVEVSRSGAVVWQQATQGRPFHVYRR